MPKKSAPSRKFDLCKFVYKRVDGTGDTIECPRTPAGIVDGAEKYPEANDDATVLRRGYWTGYISLKSQNKLGEFEGLPESATDEERCEWIMDNYTTILVPLDDDGNIYDEDLEPDPTKMN